MKLSQYKQCGTSGVRSLDLQLISQLNQLHSNALVEFTDLNISCGSGVHAYLQPGAKQALSLAIKERGTRMTCNSAYRTLAQQQLLYTHYKNDRCGISAAAKPGYSNHNSGLAIDIEDALLWRPYLERHGWRWIGSFDPMHFDFKSGGIDLRSLSIKAFQILWNANNPQTKLVEDGVYGPATEKALLLSPIDGFGCSAVKVNQVSITRPQKSDWEILYKGMKGDRVTKLQQALVKQGYKVEVDGDFGIETYSKVCQFQASVGLAVDGIVGTLTASELGLI
jgi:N-acetylmuramoyl-L-alanine amidase